ncbi:MAG TPA: galactokinase [Myxococcota bacterium]|nr:galactokinase [Myxococcota bacterium]
MARKSGETRARAPGRVNWIGEHTDYNGGLVLPAPIDLDTRVRVALRDDRRVTGRSRERPDAAAELDAPPASDWLDYPRGMARALAAAGWLPESGFELHVESDLPQGAGLSSSAALLAASALALLAAAGRHVAPEERPELARLCQRAESEFAGVPCGLMDHYAVLCGRRDSALWLDCATLETRAVELPDSHAILIFDTGVERSLRAGKYAERRAECARALAGAQAALARPLASLSQLAAAELPRLAGALDPVALRRARHVVSENRRVAEFAEAVARGDLAAAGECLFASHESLRDDYQVSCPEADALVADSRALLGCAGARMTGAGFGGCTLHWVDAAHADAFAQALGGRFRARFGRTPRHWRAMPGTPAELSSA